MSKFGDLAGAARAAHEHYFADSVTLKEPGSASQTVPAVIGKVETETRTDEQGHQQRVSVRQIRFTTITTVRHDARVTVVGDDWSIDQVLTRTASGLTVRLQRIETHSVSRVNYRGKP